ncbi:MAG: hypothetical protein BGO38_17925 [Cellulomonas sp. 73-145]|uniref:hypothetical protein n=1 Tax=Cellulomonas sp. 73-145 TaxID=1895739 RepID=UPI0009264DAF|nr:hypothetical protein [Cellulomonas sp. 73-145]MBN9327783.1 hypothetical protein [Cellulomonas sp.]OJV59143.1 MAG: hypothetical protein BGO38_17925 [Cellulomonas sp. 73-145]
MTATPTDWIEHRRAGDRELLGWLRLEDDGAVAIDRLGRTASGVLPWDEAEAVLDERGIGWLADLWELELDGRPVRVRLREVSTERVVVTYDDHGDVHTKVDAIELPFPAPATLRPFGGDRHVLDPLR